MAHIQLPANAIDSFSQGECGLIASYTSRRNDCFSTQRVMAQPPIVCQRATIT
ncbi:hypothetical protein [Spirosoma flavus]